MRSTRTRGVCAVVAALWVGVAASACGSSRGDHPAPGPSFERLRSQPPEETGAQVNGHPLGVREFQTYWDGDRSRSADEVIDGVIDREVAVQQALERGYHRDDELGFVRKKGMVRALLRREIEGELGADDVDEKLVKKIEKSLRAKLGHPRGIRASHLLVMIPKKKRKKKKKKGADSDQDDASSELRNTAATWIERIRESLPAEPTVEQLFFARREFRDNVPDPLKIIVNAHLSFPAPDARKFKGNLPNQWMRVVGPFAKAADSLLAEGRAGELSDPVDSKYGWHLVLAEKRLDGKVPDSEVLHEVAVSQALRLERAKLFEDKLEEWRQGMSIAGYPGAIADEAENEGR